MARAPGAHRGYIQAVERLERIIARNRAARRSTWRRVIGVVTAIVLLVVIALLIAYTDLAQSPVDPAQPPVQPRPPAQVVRGIYLARPPAAKPAPAKPVPAPAAPAPAAR